MKPTIGRIVHFHRELRDPYTGKAEGIKTFPAIITEVKDAEIYSEAQSEPKKELSARVVLHVFGYSEPNREGRQIQNEVPYAPEPKDGCWSWPARD